MPQPVPEPLVATVRAYLEEPIDSNATVEELKSARARGFELGTEVWGAVYDAVAQVHGATAWFEAPMQACYPHALARYRIVAPLRAAIEARREALLDRMVAIQVSGRSIHANPPFVAPMPMEKTAFDAFEALAAEVEADLAATPNVFAEQGWVDIELAEAERALDALEDPPPIPADEVPPAVGGSPLDAPLRTLLMTEAPALAERAPTAAAIVAAERRVVVVAPHGDGRAVVRPVEGPRLVCELSDGAAPAGRRYEVTPSGSHLLADVLRGVDSPIDPPRPGAVGSARPEVPMWWDGVTRTETLSTTAARIRHRFADAARNYAWDELFETLDADPTMVNRARPDGRSWFAPLHQAAHGGASLDVVLRLIALGGWRTLRTADGKRAVELAEERGRADLIPALIPAFVRQVPDAHAAALETNLHALFEEVAGTYIRDCAFRLPPVSILFERDANMRCPIPGMYGGFTLRAHGDGEGTVIRCESSSRVWAHDRTFEVDGAGHRVVESA